MKNLIILGVVILVVIGGAVFFAGSKQQVSTPTETQFEESSPGEESATSKNTVDVEGFAFAPTSLTIKAGESVTWTNKDSVGHSATADDDSFDTGVFSQGESESVTFDKPGTYSYHCTPHPNMKGTIIVE